MSAAGPSPEELLKAYDDISGAIWPEKKSELRAELLSRLSRVEELQQQVADQKKAREHTWQWISQHYGKLQDWARKILPEPWKSQFFGCLANGLYDPVADVGKPYICNAGFEVVPGGYFKMPTAEYQLLCDQMKRAELAEADRDEAQEDALKAIAGKGAAAAAAVSGKLEQAKRLQELTLQNEIRWMQKAERAEAEAEKAKGERDALRQHAEQIMYKAAAMMACTCKICAAEAERIHFNLKAALTPEPAQSTKIPCPTCGAMMSRNKLPNCGGSHGSAGHSPECYQRETFEQRMQKELSDAGQIVNRKP